MQGNFFYMLLATLTTAVCWGMYGPILHWGQEEMGKGRLRTFICVGIAYFVVAIVMPVLLMTFAKWETEEKFHLTTLGFFWSFIGGALGAIGALGIIMAFKFSNLGPNTPLVVMPLVFGLAPVVNVIFTSTVNRSWDQVNSFFAAGIILTAAGASTVLIFAPRKAGAGHGPAPKIEQMESKKEVAPEMKGESKSGKEEHSHTTDEEKKPEGNASENAR